MLDWNIIYNLISYVYKSLVKKFVKKKITILQFKDAIRFSMLQILYIIVENEYSIDHVALNWLHYICVNYDT